MWMTLNLNELGTCQISKIIQKDDKVCVRFCNSKSLT